jgi:UDPglucose 6-dehydrogenase
MPKPKIAVIGIGSVGLYTSLFFSRHGFRVMGIEKDREKLGMLREGTLPFHDPAAEGYLRGAIESHSLEFSGDAGQASASGIIFIAVGTPSLRSGKADLGFVEQASAEAGRAIKGAEGYRLVVLKSTVPPGTTGTLVKGTIESASGKACGRGLGLCMNPEFLREGMGMQDLEHPDRVIIGECDPKAGARLERVYRSVYPASVQVLRTSPVNAELIKYASNSFLATKISFINSIASLCEGIHGADVEVVARGMGMDRRISPHFLKAGIGFGGHCLPKDLEALIAYSRSAGYDPPLLRAVLGVNKAQAKKPLERILESMREVAGRRFAILGLSFKAGTDDIRGAPAIPVIESLLSLGGVVQAYDPQASGSMEKIFGGRVRFSVSARECLRDADCCLVLTEWEEFRGISPGDFCSLMRSPFVIDCRRVYDPEKYRQALNFKAIGLGP